MQWQVTKPNVHGSWFHSWSNNNSRQEKYTKMGWSELVTDATGTPPPCYQSIILEICVEAQLKLFRNRCFSRFCRIFICMNSGKRIAVRTNSMSIENSNVGHIFMKYRRDLIYLPKDNLIGWNHCSLDSTHVVRCKSKLGFQNLGGLPEFLVHFAKNTLFLSSQETSLPPPTPENENSARI